MLRPGDAWRLETARHPKFSPIKWFQGTMLGTLGTLSVRRVRLAFGGRKARLAGSSVQKHNYFTSSGPHGIISKYSDITVPQCVSMIQQVTHIF